MKENFRLQICQDFTISFFLQLKTLQAKIYDLKKKPISVDILPRKKRKYKKSISNNL